MPIFVVHDAQGQVVRSGCCLLEEVTEQALFPDEVSREYTEFVDGNDKYWNAICRQFLDRPVLQINQSRQCLQADGDDTLRFSNLPYGTMVTINEDSQRVAKGFFCFSTDIPGHYEITFERFPYRTMSVSVIALPKEEPPQILALPAPMSD